MCPHLTAREAGKQTLAVKQNLAASARKVNRGCFHGHILVCSGPFAIGSSQVNCEPGWGRAHSQELFLSMSPSQIQVRTLALLAQFALLG